MSEPFRDLLHRFVPAQFSDPLSLASRLWRTREPAARFAMGAAALGLVATPLDLALYPLERRRYHNGPQRKLPLLFICGGPRTGTTLAFQTLAAHLPCSHFTNLASIFSRSPITATHSLRNWIKKPDKRANSFYGRTSGLGGVSDALSTWDRWLGADRKSVPQSIPTKSATAMNQFFAAWEEAFELPLIAKCNSLNACAHLVANELENCYFFCLTREPLYLAQSLYEARLLIHGRLDEPYGLAPAQQKHKEDPYTSVCRQVKYHLELADIQAKRIGEKHFWKVSYEQLCSDPAALIRRVGREIYGMSDNELESITVPAIQSTNRPRLDKELLQELENSWSKLNVDCLDNTSNPET